MAGPMEIRAGPHHVEHLHRVAAFRGIVAKTYVDTGPRRITSAMGVSVVMAARSHYL